MSGASASGRSTVGPRRVLRRIGGGLRRATGSVRVRVALATAALFALVLVAAATWLLHAAEARLIDRTRRDTEAAVQLQAQRVLLGGSDVLFGLADPGALASRWAEVSPALVTGDGVAVVAYRTASPAGPGEGDAGTAGLTVTTVTSVTARGTGATDDGSGTSGDPAAGTTAPSVDAAGPVDASGAVGVAGTGDVSGTVGAGDAPEVDTVIADGGRAATLAIDVRAADRLGVTSGGPYVVATMPVAGVTLAAASSLAEVQHTIDSMRALLWWIVPALVVLVGALAWMVVGRALRPVHAVTRQLAAIGSDSLHERVPVPTVADEVGELSVTMNSMLDRLESATLVSRQLVSDASHELRTPIAVLRTELEVARRDPGTDWQAVSEGMLDEVERLQGLVDDLLLLARAGERGMTSERVDVVDVLAQVAARRRRVPVEVEVHAPLEVDGDPVALRRALDHVVANAARHAASTVRVAAAELGGRVELCVDDDGAGIAPADRDRVLERFVRLDEARARDAGGCGLGLAVASDVAVAHGGTLRIDDAPPPLGGARVLLTVPARVHHAVAH